LRRYICWSRVGIACAAFFICGAAAPGFAQSGADSGDPAALLVRIERLEDELRAATGAIEELQNQQQKLQEQVKRYQEDVEFRFKDAGSGAARLPPVASAAPAQPPLATASNQPAAPSDLATTRPSKRSDAFDPSTEPNAIGSPKPLGVTQPSAPLNPTPLAGAPLDLAHPAPVNSPSGPLGDNEIPRIIPGPAPDGSLEQSNEGPREQLNAALETYRAGQYEQAESQLRAFLAHNGGGRLAAEATFYLGESYFQRSRPREAAEQYLKLSTDYARSPRAPEGMLRLGQSLAMLGNNEQACATFGEVGRRYPTAAASIKKGVEREMQKDHC
jgi:tol-pal system protein YbgF